MNGRDLFEIWAPPWQERWTKFAKPALFINTRGISSTGFSTDSSTDFSAGISTEKTPILPPEISTLDSTSTAIIVDLSGAAGIENGLALAKRGFRPVPLYNCVNEEKIGTLTHAIDNTPIIAALKSGAEVLRKATIRFDAAPAFLLDYDRDMIIVERADIYDNRWSLDFEDLPDAEYMINAGINRVVVWTSGEMRHDLIPIIKCYENAGIATETFYYRPSAPPQDIGVRQGVAGVSIGATEMINAVMQKDVRKFEAARRALLLIGCLSFFNLNFMFSERLEPILWTAPSIMWLTYLFVPENIGDILAVVLSCMYIGLFFLTKKIRQLIIPALVIFCIDTAIFYIYVVYYSVTEYWAEWLEGYGILLLAAPIVLIIFLIRGVIAEKELFGVSDEEYEQYKGFTGYAGYGGSGIGGYRGRGYRGNRRYSGGFGG